MSDKYCSSCGNEIVGNFCSSCGKPVGIAGEDSRPKNTTAWVIAGVAVVTVFAMGATRVRDRNPQPVPQAEAPLPPLSQSLNPREQADHLFDIAMRAVESGDSAGAYYTRLAVSAYETIDLDVDGIFHLGLLNTYGDDPAAALIQADSMEVASPDHLFVPLLMHKVARQNLDDTLLQEAYALLIERYDTQIETGKPEYQSHGGMIQRVYDEARLSLP